MPVDIIVIRQPGDTRGPDIIDPLLTNVTLATLRGTTEIQDSEPVDVVSLNTVYRAGVRKGQIVEVMDAAQGITWRGRIANVSHNFLIANHTTDIDVERVR